MNGCNDTLADDLSQWVGREDQRVDRIDPRIAQALAATLDLDPDSMKAGAELPPLWHWVYFTPNARCSEIGADGHPQRGGFLPPVDLPNRMWAGGHLNFKQPLRVGEEVNRISRIVRCQRKVGRHGELVFVTVEHSVSGERGVCLVEEQDIVYRQPAPKEAPLAGEVVDGCAEFGRRIRPDPVLLFRYSALTFNSHRIHYDQPYATQEEGYPSLVVHGPLAATLLLETFRATYPDKRIRRFAFRAVGPLFSSADFDVCGELTGPDSAALWTECDGRLAMKANVTFD
ncbi:acyl-CoA dehydrogenase [Pseudomonas sp. BN414]|uniref:FAS1-like dehydratase domain-containing protein n=1 Tax=Pseudomonas TaxID=286 RepID=UPI0015BAC600|nr:MULTISPECIES: MaoC family dehydratase N-terminal domain-containing protein [Pseudomonas]MDH4565598.1 acyl-CoA dehydrogenase [Pseudomonas sp. BN414]NWL76023.1 acyl-CoA dehydrogenase [Pseudomonas taiwanensis]